MSGLSTTYEKQSTATFYVDVIITGYIAISNNDKIDLGYTDKHWLWFIPGARIVTYMTTYQSKVATDCHVYITL